MTFTKYKVQAILVAIIILLPALVKAQESGMEPDSAKTISVLNGERTWDRFVGNVNSVTATELGQYPAIDAREALAGKIPGLFVLQNNGDIGIDNTVAEDDNFNMFIRGSLGDYIVIVDGFERPFANIPIEQIKDIKVFKDPVTKSMYGGRISNGVIMITTKRGVKGKKEFHAKVQRGIKLPTKLPEYLNAADFATSYNEAVKNDNNGTLPDGLGYTDEQIEGYRSQSNPYLYPDVDYYDEFLNKSMDITRFSAEYFGGNNRTQYYFQTGIQNEGGLEKYGSHPTSATKYNLKANLDADFSDYIGVIADFGGYLGERDYPGNFDISTLSKRYPNAYPILLGADSAGGTSTFKDNPYAAQALSGFVKETYIQMQTNLGFEFKLDKVVDGLSVKPYFSFDIYHQQNLNKKNTVGIYEITDFDEQGNPAQIAERQQEKLATAQTIGTDNYIRRWAFNTLASWDKQIGDHAVTTDALFLISQETMARRFDDYKRENITLRSNYSYKGKYNVEGTLNYSGSDSYAKENRFKIFPALGFGWILSKESFLNSESVDFLRLNATWGVMGNGDVRTRLWYESWSQPTSYRYNVTSSRRLDGSHFTLIPNPEIDWPTLREIDINLEARLMKNIAIKASYFNYRNKGTVSQAENVKPGIIGGKDNLPFQNFGENSLSGVEFELGYQYVSGDWTFGALGHMTMSKSKKIVVNEIPDPLYTTVGDATDDIRGYEAIGFYTQADIDAAIAGTGPIPTYMSPKDLVVGNIKYADLNTDGFIDKYDRVVVGNETPRLMYGLNLNVGYKGFKLYASFLGYGKYNSLLRESSIYHAYTNRKYSTIVKDGLPNGNRHPVLTTGTATNDAQRSSYWIANNSFLKLKNLSLSYSLPDQWANAVRLGDITVYVYGSNVLTISKIKDSDPESLKAGIDAYPLFSTYAAGLSISF